MSTVPCSVCYKLYDGTTHCSVMVCRACAMFFRRCEEWDSIPFCKQGNRNCNLKSTGRVSCSSCRYHRCLEVGLKRRENARSLKMSRNGKEQMWIEKQRKPIKMNIDLHLLVPETMQTLKNFCYHYAIQANNRMNFELNVLREEGEELSDIGGNRRMALMKNCQYRKLGVNTYPEFVKFLNRSFPALSTLESTSQEAILMVLMFYFFDLYGSFKTWRIFKDVNTTKIVCSEVMYADFNHVNSYIVQDTPLDPMDLKAIDNYLSVTWRPHLTDKLHLLHRIDITDIEFLAASALVVWDEEVFLQIPEFSKVAEAHRNMIYKDLHYYYRNVLHLDNYVERIMNIKELIRASKRTLRGMSESVDFLRTFNYYKDNTEVWDATEKIVRVLRKNTR